MDGYYMQHTFPFMYGNELQRYLCVGIVPLYDEVIIDAHWLV